MHKLIAKLPLQFRILYRHFVLRIIDFEALSVQADIAGFLGQFAGVLLMLSLVHAFAVCIYLIWPVADQPVFAWHMEQYLIDTTILIVGLFAVITWDAAFPDRRDILVLSPLPVTTRTLLLAKMSASSALLGGAVLILNLASGVAWPFVLGAENGFLRTLAAYWIATIAAAVFLYGSLLAVQGFTALLLPRRVFLRLSAFLQLAAFVVFLCVYFLQQAIPIPAMMAPENHRLLSISPSYWYFALFHQLKGSLPSALSWLAWRGWLALGISMSGAAISLLLCYVRTMRKIVEEPDLVPAARGSHFSLRLGGLLQTATLLFFVRSLARSRQHRVVFAFYLGAGFALALLFLRSDWPSSLARRPITLGFSVATLVMMTFAVVGLRSTFSLPISLTANWVLRITQLSPPERYLAATRRSLLLLAVVPVWLGSSIYLFCLAPLWQATGHLAVLALFGSILVDLNLFSFYKVPFTCSYLPGKSNIQFGFWAFLLLFIPLAMLGAHYELQALNHSWHCAFMLSALGIVAYGLWAWNRHRSKSAVLYFEELPEEVILTLGLT